MNNFNYTNLKPFKWFCLKNFPFIEANFDAITYYELLCKIVEYLNKVIESENALGLQVENITKAVTELQTYVDNYFDNLNVQEEIDNKLDEMAESGELADIIAQYINLRGLLIYNNVEELKNADNVVSNSIVRTLGFYDYNKGGGAYYKIREITNEDIIDNITIIPINNSQNLIAELVNSDDIINVKQYGAKGDGIHNDYDNINLCIQKNNNKTIYFPDGTYLINSEINIYNNAIVDIKCDLNANFISSEQINSFFNYGLGERPSNWKIFRRHVIDGGNFDCTNADYGIILNSRSHLNYVKNINMTHVKNVGLYLKKHQDYISGDCLIENISITGETSTGLIDNIGVEIESYDNELNNIRVQGTTIGIKISGAGNKIYNAHPLFIGAVNNKEDYERSIGFLITVGNRGWNEFLCCYSDSFNTGFKITGNSINNLTNCKNNTYITPMEGQKNQFIWITDRGAILNLIGCKYYPSDPPTGINYTARVIRCDFDMFEWYENNKFNAKDCDWSIKQYIPDNDPAYGLKSNNIKSLSYTPKYTTTMDSTKYYKIGLINASQSLQKIHLTYGYEGEWDINIKWHSASTPSASVFNKIEKLFNPLHNIKIALCDTFTENGVLYGYLCLKATDNNTTLNAGFQNYSGGSNGELFTAREKFGLDGYTPSSIFAEANLY